VAEAPATGRMARTCAVASSGIWASPLGLYMINFERRRSGSYKGMRTSMPHGPLARSSVPGSRARRAPIHHLESRDAICDGWRL
jgi:hypothetical protein